MHIYVCMSIYVDVLPAGLLVGRVRTHTCILSDGTEELVIPGEEKE